MQQKLLPPRKPCRAVTRFAATLLVAFLSLHPAMANESFEATGPSPASFPYTLVGIAEFDGISYASLVDRQTGNHFLLSTDKKSELDVALISVKTYDDSAGPAALIEKDTETVLVKMGSGISLSPSFFSSSVSLVSQVNAVQNIPRPDTTSAGNLHPPPGGTLPLVFQEVDPRKMTLTDEQKATLKQLRQDFISAVNGTSAETASTQTSASSSSGNPNSPAALGQIPTTANQQLQNWINAQEHSDEMFRMLYGYQAFNAYTASSSYPVGP